LLKDNSGIFKYLDLQLSMAKNVKILPEIWKTANRNGQEKLVKCSKYLSTVV